MRSGSLKDRICLLSLQETKNETGGVKKDYVCTHTIRVERRKLSAVLGNGVNASEEFIGNTIVFLSWKYPFLKENMRVRYNNIIYSITLIDPQPDSQSCLITCKKVNP